MTRLGVTLPVYKTRDQYIVVVVLLHAQCMSTTESCALYLSQRELFAFTLEMCHLQESHFILEQTELAGKLAHLVSELS